MNRPQLSAGISTSVSLSTSAGEFYPDWLKRWDKKHGYNRRTGQYNTKKGVKNEPV